MITVVTVLDPSVPEEAANFPTTTKLIQSLIDTSRVIDTQKLATEWRSFLKAIGELGRSKQDPNLGESLRAEFNANKQEWIAYVRRKWIDLPNPNDNGDAVADFYSRLAAIRMLARIAGPDPDTADDVFDRLWRVAINENHKVDARAWSIYSLYQCNRTITLDEWNEELSLPDNSTQETALGANWLHRLTEARLRARAVRTIGDAAKKQAESTSVQTDSTEPPSPRSIRTIRLHNDLLPRLETSILALWWREIDIDAQLSIIFALEQLGGTNNPPEDLERPENLKKPGNLEKWETYRVLCDAINLGSRSEEVCYQTIPAIARRITGNSALTSKQRQAAVIALIELMAKGVHRIIKDNQLSESRVILAKDALRGLEKIGKGALVHIESDDSRDILLDVDSRDILQAVINQLTEIAQMPAPATTLPIRKRAIDAFNNLLEEAKPGSEARKVLKETLCLPCQQLLVNDDDHIVLHARPTLIAVMGEEQAADYLGDIIVDEKEEDLAALVKWRRESERKHETDPANFHDQDLKRVVRERAALALATIPQNAKAHDKLVDALRSRTTAAGYAQAALTTMGGERAIQAMIQYSLQQQVAERYFDPMEEARKKGWSLLADIQKKATTSWDYSLIVAGLTVVVGVILFGISVWQFSKTDNATDPFASGTALAGLLAVVIGLVGSYFWKPARGLLKSTSEVAQLIMSFENYLGRMRLIGLGFAHAYTEQNWGQFQFMDQVTDITGDSLRESLIPLQGVGQWPQYEAATIVTVPDLTNQPVDQAKRIAETAGLAVTMNEAEYDPDHADQTVKAQDLTAGIRVGHGTTITLTPWTNKQPVVAVPDLKGKTIRDAFTEVEKVKLKAEIEGFAFDDAAVEGTIIAQSLKAGIKVGQNEVGLFQSTRSP